MGGFEELTNDEEDPEWDAAWASYTKRAESTGADRAPLRGHVELPIGVIEIRGADLGLPARLPAPRRDHEPLLIFEVASDPAAADPGGAAPAGGQNYRWSLAAQAGGVIAQGSCASLRDVIEALVLSTIRLDHENLYLTLALVDNGSLGIGILSADQSPVPLSAQVAPPSAQVAPPSAQVAEPWRVLSDGLVAIRRYSRTVAALGLSGTSGDPGAAGQTALVMSPSTLEYLVLLDPGAPDAPDAPDAAAAPGAPAAALPDSVAAAEPLAAPAVLAALRAATLAGGAIPEHPGSVDWLADEQPPGVPGAADAGHPGQLHPGQPHSGQLHSGPDDLTLQEVIAGASCLRLPVDEAGETGARLTALLDQLGQWRPEPTAPVDNENNVVFVEDLRAFLGQLFTPATESVAVHPTATPEAAAAVLCGPALDLADRSGLSPAAELVATPTVDLLVRAEERPAIEARLLAAGLVAAAAVSTADLRSGAVQVYETWTPVAGRRFTVRVLTTLASGPFVEFVDMDDFHDLAVPVRAEGSWFPGLHPAHRFIDACLRVERNRHDAAALQSLSFNMPADLPAARRVLQLAERCGATNTVRSVVRELRNTLAGPFPTVVAELGG